MDHCDVRDYAKNNLTHGITYFKLNKKNKNRLQPWLYGRRTLSLGVGGQNN